RTNGSVPRGLEQVAHHSARGRALDPPRLARRQRVAVRDQQALAQLRGVGVVEVERACRETKTRQEPREIADRGREGGLVEVVDVEVDEAVVAQVGAEVLEVEVAARPDGGTRGEAPCTLRPILPVEMDRTAEELERVRAHQAVLSLQAARVAPRVEA